MRVALPLCRVSESELIAAAHSDRAPPSRTRTLYAGKHWYSLGDLEPGRGRGPSPRLAGRLPFWLVRPVWPWRV